MRGARACAPCPLGVAGPSVAAGPRVHRVDITRMENGRLGNPFSIPHGTAREDAEEMRRQVVAAHREWLRMRVVPAERVVGGEWGPAQILDEGREFSPRIAPRTTALRVRRGDIRDLHRRCRTKARARGGRLPVRSARNDSEDVSRVL